MHIFKMRGMAAAFKWIQEGNHKKKILIVLSGGNVDASTYHRIWSENYLIKPPKNVSQLSQ